MSELVRHRGPDDEGYAFFDAEGHSWSFAGTDTPSSIRKTKLRCAPQTELSPNNIPTSARVALGHRRLSIVDLSVAGHQPMCTDDGRYWITYNGEIYNHGELRAQLESKGYRFNSQTDTEVVLNA